MSSSERAISSLARAGSERNSIENRASFWAKSPNGMLGALESSWNGAPSAAPGR